MCFILQHLQTLAFLQSVLDRKTARDKGAREGKGRRTNWVKIQARDNLLTWQNFWPIYTAPHATWVFALIVVDIGLLPTNIRILPSFLGRFIGDTDEIWIVMHKSSTAGNLNQKEKRLKILNRSSSICGEKSKEVTCDEMPLTRNINFISAAKDAAWNCCFLQQFYVNKSLFTVCPVIWKNPYYIFC